MFDDMGQLTTGKVNTALKDDPLAKVPEAQKAAQHWAQKGAGNNPREFANRYEYARARYNELKQAALEELAGQPNAKKTAAQKAAGEVTPEQLTGVLEGDKTVERLGPGGKLEGVAPDAAPRRHRQGGQGDRPRRVGDAGRRGLSLPQAPDRAPPG